MLHAREFNPLYIPGGGEGGSSFGVLPFSVSVVVLLSLLVREVCDSLLGNPSYMKEEWQANKIKYVQYLLHFVGTMVRGNDLKTRIYFFLKHLSGPDS